MKPLELTIYPHSKKYLNTNWVTFYETPGGLMTAGRSGELPAAKHLTDAELAAEVWQAEMQWQGYSDDYCWGDEHRDHRDQLGRDADTMHRFAVTPHYYEEAE